MNKIYRISIIIFFSLVSVSCNDFLTLKPRDKKVVSTVEDYRDILASYMRLLKTNNRSQDMVLGTGSFCFPMFDVALDLGVYTGETLIAKNNQTYNSNNNSYTVSGLNRLTWMNINSQVWNRYYEFLGPINLIVNGVQNVETENNNLRDAVLGEALVWRSFAYYKLLQYYSPYKSNEYGIPVYLKPYDNIGNVMPSRNTQQEVFTQIISDAKMALELLNKTNYTEWNCAYRQDFISAMLASIYTWKAMSGAAEKGDWANAEKYASIAIGSRKLESTTEGLRKIFDCRDGGINLEVESDEFYFRIMDGDREQVLRFERAYYDDLYVEEVVNYEYYSLYKDSDIRKKAYFTEDGARSDKYNLLGGRKGGMMALFRLAEMYLIKSEALLRQGKDGEAKNVLETFKKHRYTENVKVPSNKDELLADILLERRKEFFQENDFRWLDMKRLGLEVKRQVIGQTYVLESDDFRYSFPIPDREMKLNKNMVQTPGWENVMQ